MQLTMAGEYGLLGMIYLAEHEDEDRVVLSDIARATGAPEKFLRKIFHSLTKSGLIKSYRGLGGGFTLSRPSGEITMLDIIEAIEGEVTFVQCLKDPVECDMGGGCAMSMHWSRARDAFRGALSSVFLTDLIHSGRAGGSEHRSSPTESSRGRARSA